MSACRAGCSATTARSGPGLRLARVLQARKDAQALAGSIASLRGAVVAAAGLASGLITTPASSRSRGVGRVSPVPAASDALATGWLPCLLEAWVSVLTVEQPGALLAADPVEGGLLAGVPPVGIPEVLEGFEASAVRIRGEAHYVAVVYQRETVGAEIFISPLRLSATVRVLPSSDIVTARCRCGRSWRGRRQWRPGSPGGPCAVHGLSPQPSAPVPSRRRASGPAAEALAEVERAEPHADPCHSVLPVRSAATALSATRRQTEHRPDGVCVGGGHAAWQSWLKSLTLTAAALPPALAPALVHRMLAGMSVSSMAVM